MDEEEDKEKDVPELVQEEEEDKIKSEIKRNLEQINNKEIKKPNKYLHDLVFKLENQNQVIKKFREKQFNILISTSVTEEGFDIPDCQLVIVYGEIRSFQQYIQQKGRARMKDSRFIVITQNPEIEKKFIVLEAALKEIKRESKSVKP